MYRYIIYVYIYIQGQPYICRAFPIFYTHTHTHTHTHIYIYRPSKISDSPQPLTAIWKTGIYKTLWPLFVDGVHLPQVYTESL